MEQHPSESRLPMWLGWFAIPPAVVATVGSFEDFQTGVARRAWIAVTGLILILAASTWPRRRMIWLKAAFGAAVVAVTALLIVGIPSRHLHAQATITSPSALQSSTNDCRYTIKFTGHADQGLSFVVATHQQTSGYYYESDITSGDNAGQWNAAVTLAKNLTATSPAPDRNFEIYVFAVPTDWVNYLKTSQDEKGSSYTNTNWYSSEIISGDLGTRLDSKPLTLTAVTCPA